MIVEEDEKMRLTGSPKKIEEENDLLLDDKEEMT